jgi:hypothetical protein
VHEDNWYPLALVNIVQANAVPNFGYLDRRSIGALLGGTEDRAQSEGEKACREAEGPDGDLMPLNHGSLLWAIPRTIPTTIPTVSLKIITKTLPVRRIYDPIAVKFEIRSPSKPPFLEYFL